MSSICRMPATEPNRVHEKVIFPPLRFLHLKTLRRFSHIDTFIKFFTFVSFLMFSQVRLIAESINHYTPIWIVSEVQFSEFSWKQNIFCISYICSISPCMQSLTWGLISKENISQNWYFHRFFPCMNSLMSFEIWHENTHVQFHRVSLLWWVLWCFQRCDFHRKVFTHSSYLQGFSPL